MSEIQIPEGFTPWDGGRRPEYVGTKVEVIMRCGLRDGAHNADDWNWTHGSDGEHESMYDIIAYRVIENTSPTKA